MKTRTKAALSFSKYAVCVVLAASVLGCTHTPAPRPSAQTVAAAPAAAGRSGVVQWIGGMHKAVHDGERNGKVRISALQKTPHLYAIGPVEGLRGELTVIDGEVSMGTLGPNGPTSASGDAAAAFLAWAYVPRWVRYEIPDTVSTESALQDFILRTAMAAGLRTDEPLVYRIEGEAREVKLHVIWHTPGDALGKAAHNKAKVPVQLPEGTQGLSIVGFWSDKHLGVFTPMVSPFHMHAVTRDRALSGHVDDLHLMPGAVLMLPPGPDAPPEASWAPVEAATLNPAQARQRDRAMSARDTMLGRLLARLSAAMHAPGPDGLPVGPAGAVDVCHDEAPAIARVVAQEMGVGIGRTSDRLRNHGNRAPVWASALLQSRPDEPRFATNEDGALGATFPIKVAPLCLACHGPLETLSPQVREALAKRYPGDAAVGYAEGDLRGWFWVEVPKGPPL